MKKRFTRIIAALALLVFMAPSMVAVGQTRDDVVYKTALFGSSYNSQGVSSYTGNSWYTTTNGFRLNIANANNNNNGWNYIKIGGKNGAYTGTLTTNAAIDEAVTKVDLTIDAITTSNVTSMTLYTSSNGSSWTSAGTFDKSTGVKTVTLSNPTANLYYKIEVVCTKGSSNGLVTISKVEYYHDNGGTPVNTYTVTYHANVTGVENIEVEYTEGDDVTVAANTFSNPGYAFTKWNTLADGTGTDYDPDDVIEDIDADIDLYAQWEVSTSTTGTIKFGSSTGHVKINAASVTGDDDINNEWTITTVGTTSFTQQATYSQVGSSNSPATSITFTTTLPEEVEVTSMEVKFGGFSGTAGTITMKVGSQTIGTGSLNATNDVVVNSTSTETGNELTVTVTGISKGVKCYYISYTYEEATPNPAVATTTTINVPSDFNTDIHNGTNAGTLTATVTAEGTAISGATVTWESSNTDVATIAANGAVTLVAVGTTTITASYAGVEDQYRPSTDTYELVVTDSTPIGDLVIDFESATTAYTNWTFTNMTSQQTDDITAHGGTNYGTTGGKTSASITTIAKIATPYTLTCYVSKQSGNTTESTWYIQVSSDGTTWTDVASRSAIDMNKGEWKEFSANLTEYTDVYVRVYYNGNSSTAVRNIDDLTLLTSVPSVIAPTFSPAEGLYTSAQNVTISTTTSGATIYYTLDGTDPTTSSSVYSSPINVSSTTTIKAMAVASGEASSIVSATYTIELPLSTMDQIFAKATEVGSTATTVYITLGNWVVTGANSSSHTFVSDGTKGFMIYQSDHGFSAGDILSGTVECKVQLYNGAAEITQLTSSTTGLTVTTGGTATVANIALADLTGINTGALVSYHNLTCEAREEGSYTNYYLSDGTTEIQAYKTLLNEYADYLEDGKKYNITGVFVLNNETKRINPRSAADIVEVSTYTLPITAADFTSNPATGYYFIASPVSENITPSADNGITSGNYDLYFWDEPAHTWRNYKQNSAGTNTNAGFSIENGKGYLYANQAGTTIQFTGTPLTETSKAITLSKQNTTTAHGAWNLIGNPFTEAAYLYDANGRNRAYYIMKNDGSDVISATLGTAVAKMNGIFVVADAHNEVVTFSTTAPSGGSKFLALNINQNRGDVIDRAIVNFNEGSELPKLQLFESTKLYIPQDEGDYAVVNGNNQGTLPINFKATANGTYTLNIDTENVTFSTLILHDNLTGEDINLLAKATYSFEATTSDEETRFTLTYSKDGEGVALPYSYGFETTLAEEGWTAITNISNSGVSTGEESHSGTHFFRFNYNENPSAYLVTPLLTGTENGVAVSFYYRSYMESWPDSFKVGYSTDETVTDPSEFTYGPLIEDAPEEWTLYEGFLPAGTKYMAIQYVYSDGYYLYLDDFSFVEPDACPKPGSLNVANVTDNAATLTWTGNSDSYSVKLGCATNITSMGNYNFEDETIDAAFDNDTEYPWVIWNENPNDGSYCIASGNYGEHSTTSSISMTVNFEKTGIIEFFSRAESESISYDYGFFSIDGELQFMEGGETSFNWKKHRFEVEPGTHVFTWSYLKDYSMSGHADRFFIDDIQIKSADYTWNTYTTTNTTYAFEGLTPDTDYKVLVQGICGDETSVDSEPFAFTTDMAIPTFEKTITAYTDNSGYYLIASPVGNDLGLTPATEVTNLVDGSFDLYMFDQTGDDDGKQWLNYKANAFSTLEMGLGYLYANSETVILTFTGTPIDTDEDFMIEVIYDAGSDFPGLNLLGNPFAEDAYLVNNEGIGLAYHRLDPTTNTYITVDDDSAIEAMEGIFYEANAAGQVFFSTTVPTTSKSNLNITVSQGRGMIDNAIVRFGEGNTLRKISLRDNSTKVYIPQNGNEYALVNANEFGEMPVNFKAESNGTYTLSFSNQNIEFSYLHLIDNLTGADVDLLANPSYSFNATTSDYASRFKLVFTAGNTSSDSDFAYVSNGNVIVNGEGTLQVIDMMGRVISTEQINGVSSIKLNAAAGVYVLQLNDKTQKIVVK